MLCACLIDDAAYTRRNCNWQVTREVFKFTFFLQEVLVEQTALSGHLCKALNSKLRWLQEKKAGALYSALNAACCYLQISPCDPLVQQERQIYQAFICENGTSFTTHTTVCFMRQSCQTVDGYVRHWSAAAQLLFILTAVSVFLFMLHYFVFLLFFSNCIDFSPTIQFQCAVCECCVSFSIGILILFVQKWLNAEKYLRLYCQMMFAKHHMRLRDVGSLITVKAGVKCSMSSDLNVT